MVPLKFVRSFPLSNRYFNLERTGELQDHGAVARDNDEGGHDGCPCSFQKSFYSCRGALLPGRPGPGVIEAGGIGSEKVHNRHQTRTRQRQVPEFRL